MTKKAHRTSQSENPKKGKFGPKQTLLGPIGAQKRFVSRPKCVLTMIPTQWDQSAAVRTKSGPMGTPKGPFGAKAGPFGAPGVPQRSVKEPKRMIWMRPFWGHRREKPNLWLRSHRNVGCFTHLHFPDSFIDGPATEFLPVAFGHFRPFPRTCFCPGTPGTP